MRLPSTCGLSLLVALAMPTAAFAAPQAGDIFGHAIAFGHFDSDDCLDVAVGMPGRTSNGVSGAGEVDVYFADSYLSGGATRCPGTIPSTPSVVLSQSAFGQTPTQNAHFGSSLAAGNFNGSKHGNVDLPVVDVDDDLAIGAPNATNGGHAQAGKVYVGYKCCGMLGTVSKQVLGQNLAILGGTIDGNDEANDHFGWSLAAADFNADGADDLAIGVPDEDVANNTIADGGAVHVLYGTIPGADNVGLTAVNQALFSQGTAGLDNAADLDDNFGFALAAGYLQTGSDAYADLAIGSPGATFSGRAASGQVHVIFGGSSRLSPTYATKPAQLWNQGVASVDGLPEVSDQFGYALAIKDNTALIVGVPGENDAGAISVLFSGANGLVTTGNYCVVESDLPSSTSQAGNQFGYAVAAGNFNGRDVAVGAPGKLVAGNSGAGMVYILDLQAITTNTPQQLTQAYSDAYGTIGGAAEANDAFGSALASGIVQDLTDAFTADHDDDLFVGSVGENLWAGLVHGIFDRNSGGLTTENNYYRSQP